MKMIRTTAELSAFCAKASTFDYVTLDTEFLRERTYYSKLCLVQIAVPDTGPDSAVLVDTLSGKLKLDPLFELFKDTSTVKVFHAARQDLEIFYFEGGVFPQPFFDTQIAAMVCGFGEQVGYETLVRKIVHTGLDKSSRFTDWSQRPLSEKQMKYALADVTHLRDIYEFLADKIAKSNRTAWVEEEVQVLVSPKTYDIDPQEAWMRVKTRNTSGKLLAVVRELAKFREIYAREQNVPRARVYKDDAMLEVAANRPKSLVELGKSRLLLREARRGPIATGILAAVKAGVDCAPEDYPTAKPQRIRANGTEALSDLLRVLLKAKAQKAGVAQKLIATSAELDEIASGNDSPALNGWRNDVFGKDARKLCDGKIALSAKGSAVNIVKI